MRADALEIAQRLAAARRGGSAAYYEAGALTSSHDDAKAVMSLWLLNVEARSAIRREWPALARALDALVEGWREQG